MTYFPFVIFLIVLLFLFSKRVMSNQMWRATMTPLASIIGSGFLIAAPILNELGGDYAPYIMLGLCVGAYSIGEVIRWNILNIEPIIESSASTKPLIYKIDIISSWALAFAYVLSITYYLYLFSSFFLEPTGLSSEYLVKALAITVFISIAFFGHQHGLESLEKIEGVTVNIKLAIITTFILGLAYFNYTHAPPIVEPDSSMIFGMDKIGSVLGLLIMVQGFETSRYLSESYNSKTRVSSMRYSQIVSSVIYLLFIFLFIPVFDYHPLIGKVSETSIISMSSYVFKIAPLFLLVAAIASQLSASVADLGGSGGLINELSHKKISSSNAYLIICALGVLIILFFDIFSIISLASKAFAIYYAIQALNSCFFYFQKNHLRFLFSFLVVLLCLSVVFLGQPFE